VTDSGHGLLGTRYPDLARNTIDYWMQPDDPTMSAPHVLDAIARAPATPDSTLRLYLHVPFCAQRCRFCAFSGGNSLDYKQAEEYAALLVAELRASWARTAMKGQPIRSVNIGGGSPDLLGQSIETVLQAVQELPGFGEHTELSVEMTLSTVKQPFIDALAKHGVTKVSFGLQSLDPAVRGYMRQPKSLSALHRALDWIDGRIPVVNADLMTGLPGQTRDGVAADLDTLMEEPRISAISSYLLTAGAAPALLAAVEAGTIPQLPAPLEQALMRLSTYGAFRRAGWVRHGTNTYVDPKRIDSAVLARLAGDECIGASRYETFLVGVGPQAVGSLPGVRVENIVDIEAWCAAVRRGEPPLYLPKCSTTAQRDIGLWTFPLRWEGLPYAALDAMRSSGAVSARQLATLSAFGREGLIVAGAEGYALSLLGEVFMGHLVRDLKGEASRAAVDAYVREGAALGSAIASGRTRDGNQANNRQRVLHSLSPRRV